MSAPGTWAGLGWVCERQRGSLVLLSCCSHLRLSGQLSPSPASPCLTSCSPAAVSSLGFGHTRAVLLSAPCARASLPGQFLLPLSAREPTMGRQGCAAHPTWVLPGGACWAFLLRPCSPPGTSGFLINSSLQL